MRICTDENILSSLFQKVMALKQEGFEKEEIGKKLAYTAFQYEVANFQLRNLIDTAFLEKNKV